MEGIPPLKAVAVESLQNLSAFTPWGDRALGYQEGHLYN
jgi:hypothetical protein